MGKQRETDKKQPNSKEKNGNRNQKAERKSINGIQPDGKRTGNSRKIIGIVTAIVLVLAAAFGLWKLSGAGAEPSEKLVFKVGTQEVYLDEVYFCIVQNVMNTGLTAEQLQSTTDSGSTMAASYKQEILKQIMNYKIESAIAKEQGIVLTDEEEKTIRRDVTNYLGQVDARILNQWGITQELIDEVSVQRYMAEKLENTVKEDVEVDEQRFCTLYIMMFPKIEMTEDGDYARQEDGETPIILSEEELQKVKTDAENALQELEDGADAEEVAKKYGVDAYSQEESNLVDSFEEPFLEYAQNLKENECSPLIDMDAYYAIVKVTSENNEENAEQILSYYRADLETEAVEEQRKIWYEQSGVGEEPDFVGNTWEKISLYDFVQ